MLQEDVIPKCNKVMDEDPNFSLEKAAEYLCYANKSSVSKMTNGKNCKLSDIDTVCKFCHFLGFSDDEIKMTIFEYTEKVLKKIHSEDKKIGFERSSMKWKEKY